MVLAEQQVWTNTQVVVHSEVCKMHGLDFQCRAQAIVCFRMRYKQNPNTRISLHMAD